MKYVWSDKRGKWVRRRRRRVRTHQVITDTHAPFKSMADGQIYDSKSRYRAEIKARGYEEIGNERVINPTYEPAPAVDDIKQALQRHGLD